MDSKYGAGLPMSLPYLGDPLQQQQALLNMPTLMTINPLNPGTLQPQQEPPVQPDLSQVLNVTLASLVGALAKTVKDLSTLPGAQQYISPDMDTVINGITQPRSLTQHTQMKPPTQDFNNLSQSHPSFMKPAAPGSVCKQQPTTPPAHFRSAQYSPVTPARAHGQALLAAAGARGTPSAALRMEPAPTWAASGGVHPNPLAQMGTHLQPPGLPANQPALPALPSNVHKQRPATRSSSDDSSSDSDSEGGEAKPPSSKRVCTDVLTAQRALAAVMGLKQQQAIMAAGHGLTHPSNAGPLTTPPAALALMSLTHPGLPLPFMQPPLVGAASVGELLEAADILTSLHNNHSMGHTSSEEPEQDGDTIMLGQGTFPAAAFTQGAPAAAAKPRRRTTAAAATNKKRRDKGQKGSPCLQKQADALPEETHAAVRRMWEEHGQSLPVAISCSATASVVSGTFKLVGGKKKIITSEGVAMDPVQFERIAGRNSTRNWQISIYIPGLYSRPGCKQLVNLGQATRILGVHYASAAPEAQPAH